MKRPPISWASTLLGVGLAISGAVLLTSAFAPYRWWPFVFVGLVPISVAQHRVLPARLSALAPAIGVGGFTWGCFHGIFPPRAAWYMHSLPLLIGVAVFLATRGEKARYERTGYGWLPFRAAVGWVAIELCRAFIPVLGTWGFLGYALFRQTWFLQPVSVFGTFGLDLLIALVNYALALAAIATIDRWAPHRTETPVPARVATRWLGVALVALFSWSALCALSQMDGATTVRIGVLQPGHRRHDFTGTTSERERAMLTLLSQQTREAARRGARVIVWPEAALGSDPQVAFPVELAALARETSAYLVVGYGFPTPTGNRNEAVTIDPTGAFVSRYGKNHPVLFMGGTSVSRGTYPTTATAFGTIGTIICYDMDFTDTARRIARAGARIIAVPSADWPAIATTHYIHSVFRALETGAAVAKSEYSLDSAIVDGFGRIVASAITPAGSSAVLVADVQLRPDTPLATRFGDWCGWLCVAVLAASFLLRLAARAGRRERRILPPQIARPI